jgi:hypothetical protein
VSRQVLVWDLRGGSGAAAKQLTAVRQCSHPVLLSVSLPRLLESVPGLASQTDVPRAAPVHSLLLDPADCRRAAFHLACGWSGAPPGRTRSSGRRTDNELFLTAYAAAAVG